jgi:3-hydroxyacyl-CoA dehydrogenase / enoyl-CoA hydratase / 3-hydroxybutyryl-CoA epimerase
MLVANTSPFMPQTSPVTYSVDRDGVGWIVFDTPARKANLFDEATRATLAAVVDAIDAQPPVAVVILSGKERIFVAGADFHALAALDRAADASEFARTGQQLFERIARLRVPVVCAIHGACAGGGYELALACRYRIATDAPETQIGLPETSIGTIPGWGGCVRLPRLIGPKAALGHILKGQLVDASSALRAGMIDEVVPREELKSRASEMARHLIRDPGPRRAASAMPPPAYFTEVRETTRAKTGGHQPALFTAIDVVERTAGAPLADALEEEARAFGEVTAGPVCKAMLRAFFLRDQAKKRNLQGWFEDESRGSTSSVEASNPPGGAGKGMPPAEPPSAMRLSGGASPYRSAVPAKTIQRVGVIGAGVMGSGVAQWLSARGYDVLLRDVKTECVERGMEVIRRLYEEAVKRGKLSGDQAKVALRRIHPTTEWEGFESCDLVIEAIVESVEMKRQLFCELAAQVPVETILASNTSALPIEEIAGHVPNPSRTIGIHFFNPVNRMPLVEVILAQETSAETAGRALEWVKSLGKLPVICRSSPGFLVTRVLFFYLNEAVRLWERGLSTEQIDRALVGFGWPMGPLRLIDEVGLDVTAAIFTELAHYFPKRFVTTTACDRLLAAGLRGRKAGTSAGFYTYPRDGDATVNRSMGVPPLSSERRSAPSMDGRPVPRDAHEISDHLMGVMIDEAERCLAERVVRTADEVDFALLMGAGFPAFRGGLMHYARSLPQRSAVSSFNP